MYSHIFYHTLIDSIAEHFHVLGQAVETHDDQQVAGKTSLTLRNAVNMNLFYSMVMQCVLRIMLFVDGKGEIVIQLCLKEACLMVYKGFPRSRHHLLSPEACGYFLVVGSRGKYMMSISDVQIIRTGRK